MAIVKTIEVVANSTSGIEDAVSSGIAKVGETVKNIERAWVKDTEAVIRAGSVVEWRVTLVVTFIVE